MVRDCPDLIEIVESYDELETQIAADQIAPASAEAPADSFILAGPPVSAEEIEPADEILSAGEILPADGNVPADGIVPAGEIDPADGSLPAATDDHEGKGKEDDIDEDDDEDDKDEQENDEEVVIIKHVAAGKPPADPGLVLLDPHQVL